MNSSNENDDANIFYIMYQQDPESIKGPVILSFILFFLMVFGVIGNLGIVVLTYRNPRLKNSCNYLLAFLCLSDCLHQLGHVSYIYRMIAGHYFMSLRICFFIQFIPMVGMLLGVVLPMLISLDRLCSFFFSQIHLRLNTMAYTGFVIAVCGTYVFSILYMCFKESEGNEQLPSLCIVPDPIVSHSSWMFTIFMSSTFVINGIAVSFYVAVWIGLHVKKHVSEVTKRTFRALSAVIFSLLLGWVTTAICHLAMRALGAGVLDMYYGALVSSTNINIVCSSNAIWLLMFSRDYRNALYDMKRRRLSKVSSLTNTPRLRSRSRTDIYTG